MKRLFLAGCLAALIASTAFASDTVKPVLKIESPSRAEAFKQPRSLAELLAIPPKQLDKVDLAVMNLLCAEGLRGAETIDVEKLLATLDSWTRWIDIITKHNFHRFLEDPKYFHNSEGDYRMAMLSSTLQQDFGVRYNPERAEPQLHGNPLAEPSEVFFANSKDLFIHGLLADYHYGTCSSLPVLFVAVARRLGYPVHLATSKGHFLVRYEEGGHHFNVEATSPGYSVFQDDHYKNWPIPTTNEEIRNEHYFQPLNASETLADFLVVRASCLSAAGQLELAREAAAVAHRLAPGVSSIKRMLDAFEQEISDGRKQAKRERLLAEISNLKLPEDVKFEHFRDAKISLHFYLSTTGDLDGTDKALASLKMELAAENRIDGPARITLPSENPQPHPTIEIVVMPETVTYVTLDGQKIKTLVKSPEQLQSFLCEQRILDKVAEIKRNNLQAAGLSQVPWRAMRPTSIQVPPGGMPRDMRLRLEEAKLDKILESQRENEPALSQKIQVNAPNPSPFPQETQTFLDFVNALNRQSYAPRSPLPSLPGQMTGMLTPPAILPQIPGAVDPLNDAYELRRQFELLVHPPSANPHPTEKDQK